MTLNRIQAEAGQGEREREETGDLMLSNCSKLHPPSIMASLPLFYIPPFFQSTFHSLPCLHSSFSSLSHSPLDVSLTMRQAVLAFLPHPSHPPNSLSLSLSFSSFSSLLVLLVLSVLVWISWSHTAILEQPHMCIRVEEGARQRKRERECIVYWFNPRSADRVTNDAQHLLHHNVYARSTFSLTRTPQHYLSCSPIS